MTKISFIGLGNMGNPMVFNLLKSNYELNIFDINEKLYRPFNKTKSRKTKNIEELAKDSKIFFTMLPDGKALKNVVLGKKGLINYIKKKSVLIDCSSADYKSTIEVSEALNKVGVDFLDAPVSGGVSGAKSATLTIMIGGKKNVFLKYRAILNKLGKNVLYLGKSGSGQIVKACNNMMLGINMIGICEAFLLAKKYNIDLISFFNVCSTATSSSWAMLNHLPIEGIVKSSAANNNFKSGYAAKLIQKDLKISQEMARNVSFKTLMGKKASELYNKFCNEGNENLDYSAIIKNVIKQK